MLGGGDYLRLNMGEHKMNMDNCIAQCYIAIQSYNFQCLLRNNIFVQIITAFCGGIFDEFFTQLRSIFANANSYEHKSRQYAEFAMNFSVNAVAFHSATSAHSARFHHQSTNTTDARASAGKKCYAPANCQLVFRTHHLLPGQKVLALVELPVLFVHEPSVLL